VKIVQGVLWDVPDITLVIISAGKKAISYMANKKDRASKSASYAQSYKGPYENYGPSGSLNQFFQISLLPIRYSFYLNKGTGDPICKQCKVSLN
jgi:hypothetical protein